MKKLKFLIDFFLIAFFTLFVAYFTNRAGYLALDGDGYAQATKIKFIADFWPNINWVYFWGNGIPVFLWYGFMPYAFLVFFYKVFSSAPLAISAVNLLTFFMIGIGVYGIVYEVTENRLASLLSAFLTIASPGLWYRVQVGTTTRTFGDGFLVLSVWSLIKFLKEKNTGSFKLSTLLGLVISLGFALQAHFFPALITTFFVSIIILFTVQGFWSKIKFFFLSLLPAFLLAFYFLVPYVLTGGAGGASQAIGFFKVDPLNLKLLFYRPPEVVVIPGGGLLPIHLPLLGILLMIVFFLRKLKDKPFVKKVFFAFLALLFFFMFFGTAIYFGYPANWYNVGFVPDEAFEFLSLVIPVLIGISLWLGFSKKLLRILGVIIFLVLVNLVIWQYPIRYPLRAQILPEHDPHGVYDKNPNWGEHLIWRLLENQAEEKNYRYGQSTTEISLWFNFDSQISQNREYFPHGVVYPNWRYWQENAIWNPEWDFNLNEAKFLLDWFAIRWFSLFPPASYLNREKYLADPAFKMKVEEPVRAEAHFEFKEVSPILSATNAPSMLVIGEKSQDQAYGPLVRLFSTLNFNSQVVIPVRGGESLGDYKLGELTNFPLIFLYEYRLENPQREAKLLLDYLNLGGKVLIESTSFVSEAERKIFEKALGFESQIFEVKDGRWDFTFVKDNLIEGVDFSLFSPPIFEGSAWKVWGLEAFKENQKPILYQGKKVVVFRQKVGQGELIWSGVNLPYHALSYKNTNEAKFVARIIFDLLGRQSEPLSLPKHQAKFINPQERQVILAQSTSGILFKENYFFNWQAFFQKDSQKRKLKVYPAGPDFIYVPLGKSESSGTVIIFYQRSLMEKGSMVVSLFSLIALLALGIGFVKFGPTNFNNFLTNLGQRSVGRLTHWWSKEDEG